MLYDELLEEFTSSQVLSKEDAKKTFDNILAHLKFLKERNNLHYADYVLACQDLQIGHDYGYIRRLIQLIEPERWNP